VLVSNHPLAVSPGYPIQVAASNDAYFKDYDVEWKQNDKVGLAAPFAYQP
jgi:hypothetical protein